MYEKIKARYLKGYIRRDQLKRYVVLGILDANQYEEISGEKYA